MLKKTMLLIFYFSFTTNFAIAETCPSVAEIQHHLLRGWQAYDLDNGETLSNNEMTDFINNLISFDHAAWLEDAPEGSAECFYTQANAYLAQQNIKSDILSGYWYHADDGSMICKSTYELCQFLEG